MSSLDRFLAGLLDEGRAFLDDPPSPTPDRRETANATDRLAAAYALHALDVAGPPIPFDPTVAVAVAHWFQWVCWFVVDHNAPPEMTATALSLRLRPTTASEHLSADLILQFAPSFRRRLAARADGDPLPEMIEQVLRHWPLSHALSRPGTDPGPLGDHPGLWLLYAERVGRVGKPGPTIAPGPVADRLVWVQYALSLEVNRGG